MSIENLSQKALKTKQYCSICNSELSSTLIYNSNLDNLQEGYFGMVIKNKNYFLCKEHFAEWNTAVTNLMNVFFRKYGVETK